LPWHRADHFACVTALRAKLLTDMDGFADDNAAGCIQRPPFADVLPFLKRETLQADPAFLGALMADHTQLDWRPLLPRITLPCLVMVGRKSQCFPWQGVQYVADHIPGATVDIFEEGDHWLYIEEAPRFAAAVAAFATAQ
jgi:non-heme chloroperoxidase